MPVGPSNLAKDQREIYLAALRKLAQSREAEGDVIKAEADAGGRRGDANISRRGTPRRSRTTNPPSRISHRYRDGGGGELREMHRRVAELYAKMATHSIQPSTSRRQRGVRLAPTTTLIRKARQLLLLRAHRAAGAGEEKIGVVRRRLLRRKAMAVLNSKDADADLLDWATHTDAAGEVMEPKSNRVRLVEARCLRRGDRDGGGGAS